MSLRFINVATYIYYFYTKTEDILITCTIDKIKSNFFCLFFGVFIWTGRNFMMESPEWSYFND